jgi:pyruvate/2-oxoglutarate/acetoin dehydrogenase E1 component/TPP-dependent pyruvate/acetoin dehydrogenase alpha subunit
MSAPAIAIDHEGIYRSMVTARKADERIRAGLAAGEFVFTYWPITGHEAIAAGFAGALQKGDQVVITYRGMADALALGVPLGVILAEFLGKQNGISKGKGGAMGLSVAEKGLALSTGIVGAGTPIAGGLALAHKLRGSGSAVVASFGDGATSTGAIHEAMNLAALWSLPVVFLCQNNAYGEHTPVEEYTLTKRLADRAAAYGMAGETVDGRDPIAVRDVVAAALARARAGGGPTFVEALTFRLEGHYFGDAMLYVNKDRLAAEWALDPVAAFRTSLQEKFDLGTRLAEIDAEADAWINAEVGKAIAGTAADPRELVSDVAGTAVPVSDAPAQRDLAAAPAGPTRKIGVAQAVNDALDTALGADDRVFILGEDVQDPVGGTFAATKGLSTKYGIERVRPTPIAETAIVGAAIGAALNGYRPVAEIMFTDFFGVCLDQIANHAAKIRYLSGGRNTAPLTIRAVVGAGTGPQHSQALEAWLTHVPGLKVVWASNPYDAKGLLLSCIDDDDPCVFIESMSLLYGTGRGEVPTGSYRIPLGQAAIRRAGRDVTLVSYGPTVWASQSAAESLSTDGVQVEVIDLRSLVPLDLATVVASVRKTGRLVVAHEAVRFGGFGAELTALVTEEAFSDLRAPVARVGAPFTPVPHAESLYHQFLPSASAIEAALRKVTA